MMWKIVCALTVVIVAHLFRSSIITGQFQRGALNHAPGECHLVKGIEHGAEDMVLLNEGKALLSTGLQDKDARHLPCYTNIRGKMMLFDFNRPLDGAQPLDIIGDVDMKTFNPHGLSTRGPHKDGTYTIYLVNHPGVVDHVEVFTLDKEKTSLTLKRTITDEKFGSINSIQVVGDNDEFFITNIQYYNNYYVQMFENFFFLNWGNMLYYDGVKATVAQEGFGWPNGVNISPDKKFLYMAESLNSKLHVFYLNNDNTLRVKETADLYTVPDNVDVSADGDVWIGCHPRLWSIYSHVHGRSIVAPSQVLRLRINNGHVTSVQEVYGDDGHRIQGSSSAVRHLDGLLVGTITHKAAYCKITTLAI